MNDGCIDLIATDPPFNTGRNRSSSAGSYEDDWRWHQEGEPLPDQWLWENPVHSHWMEEIRDDNEPLYHAIEAVKRSHSEGMAAFICFLSVRLLEMRRILKPTGSIFVHCDATANAYIRMAMDAIFGRKNLINEIVWRKYAGRKNNAKRKLSTQHDTIFFYQKSAKAPFYPKFVPHSEREIENEYKFTDEDGRLYRKSRGGSYQRHGIEKRLYLDESPGRKIGTLWVEDGLQLNTSSKEKTQSPDQKPLELYKRIIELATVPGDWVLDPFCGCATTPIAAELLKRNWVGIDRRTDAEGHILNRLLYTSNRADSQRFIPFDKKAKTFDPDRLQEARNLIASMNFVFTDIPPEPTTPVENVPVLKTVAGVETLRKNRYTYAEMKDILIKLFDAICWGCGYTPQVSHLHDPKDYLELDHIDPVAGGGSNELTNRALLCAPCNRFKSDSKTLLAVQHHAGFRTGNRRRGIAPPIELKQARDRVMRYVNDDVQQAQLAASA